MALLNPHRLYWLYTERRLKGYNGYLEYRPSSTGTMMRDWSDRDYFYVEYRSRTVYPNHLNSFLFLVWYRVLATKRRYGTGATVF